MILPGGMDHNNKEKEYYKSGDLAYCDVLEVAKHEWEFAARHRGGRLMYLESITDTWPHIMCIILEARVTLKVAKIYIPRLEATIRAPFKSLTPHYKEKGNGNN
jgi:hypothetical protein